MLEHCREQQGAEKQDMIEAGPDMPDPGLKIFEKLAPERNRMALEPPGIVVGAEHRRMGSALLLEPQQPTMLRIQIEEKGVLDGQNLRNGRAVGGKPQNRVGAVTVAVDQMLGDRNRAAYAIGGNSQPGQCESGDFLMLHLDLSPGDLAVAVGIEPNSEVEVAQCDIPLSSHALAVHRKREVAVARLVGIGERNPQGQQQNQSETPHRSA